MPVSGTKRETLPVTIARDASTGLPLLREQQGIFDLVLAYLALPYSMAEYGCGKKTSIILDFLLNLGIPPYALNRGMIMERDMSSEALAETDADKRRHALVIENPLYHLGDTRDPRLREMLVESCPGVVIKGDEIQAGPYTLHHERFVQFVLARSHIFSEVTFWDPERGRAVRRVVDPTVDRHRVFRIREMRAHMNAPDALLFRAPLLGFFGLDATRLTLEQEHHVAELLDDGREIKELGVKEHAELVRNLSGAAPGSIGDPMTWTYANNVRSEYLLEPENPKPYRERDSVQRRDTGRTGDFHELTTRLVLGREARGGDVPGIRAELGEVIDDSDLRRIVRDDARWSEEELQIPAAVAGTMVYYRSMTVMAGILRARNKFSPDLYDPDKLEELRGTGVRLRRRIDLLGRVSREGDGRIDARALTPGFTRATVETIRQMNRAGLTVFIDRVGNCHGLMLTPQMRERLKGGARLQAVAMNRIAFGSHIDTVNDAGKFDGRLGVLSGIETAHVLRDLDHYHGLSAPETEAAMRIQVTAYIGEEMTFTGLGISMPGSAAVAGRAEPERIHEMRNVANERFGDLLIPFLRELSALQHAGRIELFNDLAGAGSDAKDLLNACSNPSDFYTPHTYERHIEQGPILDRAEVPIVLVGTIMGIHQEDFHFKGNRAESAALALNGRFRRLALDFLEAGDDIRVTGGILEGDHSNPGDPASPSACHEDVSFALECVLRGELNHAGATPTPDRRDPGVAAARMAAEFTRRVDALNAAGRTPPPRAIVGNVRLLPGTNRNVIPGEVRLSMAIQGRDALDENESNDLEMQLRTFAAGVLSRDVNDGGEGVELTRLEPVSFVRSSSRSRLSLDLRSPSEAAGARFLEEIERCCERISAEYQVEIERVVHQELKPQELEETGQVLMMERSYGGSHNPRETELLNDIIRGSILQTTIAWEAAALEGVPTDFNLFHFVQSRFPDDWLKQKARFTSGALHDTCNIAMKAAKRQVRGQGLERRG